MPMNANRMQNPIATPTKLRYFHVRPTHGPVHTGSEAMRTSSTSAFWIVTKTRAAPATLSAENTMKFATSSCVADDGRRNQAANQIARDIACNVGRKGACGLLAGEGFAECASVRPNAEALKAEPFRPVKTVRFGA